MLDPEGRVQRTRLSAAKLNGVEDLSTNRPVAEQDRAQATEFGYFAYDDAGELVGGFVSGADLLARPSTTVEQTPCPKSSTNSDPQQLGGYGAASASARAAAPTSIRSKSVIFPSCSSSQRTLMNVTPISSLAALKRSA